jgi:3-deoxy-D-arabino-heptulosonate 7-phosphate (DAHP) synthase
VLHLIGLKLEHVCTHYTCAITPTHAHNKGDPVCVDTHTHSLLLGADTIAGKVHANPSVAIHPGHNGLSDDRGFPQQAAQVHF